MKRLLILAAVLFPLGCGPLDVPPLCQTRCGVGLMNIPEGWTENQTEPWSCEIMQELEDVTLKAFADHVTDPRFASACTAMKDYRIFIADQRDWWDNYGRHISGITYCAPEKVIYLGNYNPFMTAYAHELAHAVQDCVSLGTEPANPYPGHENWEALGIYSATDQFYAEGLKRGNTP